MSFSVENNLENSFIKRILAYKSSKFLLAISGGVDSMVLYHLLLKFNINFSMAHCNFCIRGEDSQEDELFLRQISKRDRIKLFVKCFDMSNIKKSMIQTTARDFRYRWFRQLLDQNGLDYVLLAHNIDDNIETFFINLIRGTGLKGLKGMRVLSNNILRPMLDIAKEDIINYAKANNIKWREDKSNKDTIYKRNQIRHNLIPELKKINPNYISSFSLFFSIIGDTYKFYKSKVEDEIKPLLKKDGDIYRVKLDLLKNKSPLNLYIYEIFNPFGFENIDDIINIISSSSGKMIFSENYVLLKDREDFIIKRKNDINQEEFYIKRDCKQLIKPINLKISVESSFETTNSPNIAQFDLDKLKFPLILRRWKKGDRFSPFGMEGSKKLSKYFKDEKLSIFEKERIWVILSNSDIIWVMGYRIDDIYKVEEQTKSIYKIIIKD